MSRIGKRTINLPKNTRATIDNQHVQIDGPKGKLSCKLSECIRIEKQENRIQLYIVNTNQKSQSLYGLSRTLINNMIIGVSQGFNKQLEIHGVGYRAQTEGKNLVLNVGYSHTLVIRPPIGIFIEVENNNKILVHGINKALVGQIAAKIRSIRPPEPYKGKGIRYLGETVQRKVGKAGK